MQADSFFSRIGMISAEEFFSVPFDTFDLLSQLKTVAACIAFNEPKKAEEFYTKLHIPAQLSLEEEKLLHAIELRLFSKNSTHKNVFRWQKMHLQFKQHVSYPENIQAITFSKGVILNDRCPCCMSTTGFSVDGECAPLTIQGVNSWMCPHCLALREWNYAAVRQLLWDYFMKFFKNFPRDAQGLLSTEDAYLVCQFVMALAPLALIRFGYFQTDAMGHLILNPALYIGMKSQNLMLESLDFLGYSKNQKIANAYLAEKWKEIFTLDPAAAQIAHLLEGTPFHIIELTNRAPEFYFDFDLLACSNMVHPFSFSLAEHCKGRNELKKMGIPANAPFVLIHIRDDAYDYAIRPQNEHIFKNILARNADIDNYQLVAEYLVSLGYYVLRTGHTVRKAITWTQSHIIDYAMQYRSDFMDVWLFANCEFCISTASGPTSIPTFFHKPSIYTDLSQPVSEAFLSMGSYMALPKKTIYKDSLQRVTCAEYANLILKNGHNEFDFLEYIDNSPEEILEVVKEKLAIMHGHWSTTPLLEKLQDRYDAILFALARKRNKNAYRGYRKLRKYKNSQRIHHVSSAFLLADYAQECEKNGGEIDLDKITF